MANARTLRKEASSLLRAAKSAFKFLRDNPAGGTEVERAEVLQQLLEVIDRADPPDFDERLTTIQLTMTNPTLSVLIKAVEERRGHTEEDDLVWEALQTGTRRTQQRAYLRLELDPCVLRRLSYVLLHTETDHQDKAFKRLAADIEAEALSKNPMDILGRMGL